MALSDTVHVETATAAGSERRVALARQVLALLSRALPASSQLEFALAFDARPERSAAARIVVHEPDALGRLLWPPSADALGEAFLRGNMPAARRGFEDGSLDVAHLLLARPGGDGPAQLPLRPWWNG